MFRCGCRDGWVCLIADPRKVAEGLGSPRYWGKCCPSGHTPWRYTLTGKCIACASARKKRRLKRDPELRRRLNQKKRKRMTPEKKRASRLRYKRNRRHAVQVAKKSAAHRRRGATGTFTFFDIMLLFLRQNGRCVYCRRRLARDYQVDHILAVSAGGANDPKNLQLTCPKCNADKSDKHPVLFAQEVGMLL